MRLFCYNSNFPKQWSYWRDKLVEISNGTCVLATQSFLIKAKIKYKAPLFGFTQMKEITGRIFGWCSVAANFSSRWFSIYFINCKRKLGLAGGAASNCSAGNILKVSHCYYWNENIPPPFRSLIPHCSSTVMFSSPSVSNGKISASVLEERQSWRLPQFFAFVEHHLNTFVCQIGLVHDT